MNIKNNKGFVSVDASIAVMILLILVPTIMGIVYNINITTNATEVKTRALNIATNVIEIAKGTELTDNNSYRESILNKVANSYNSSVNKENGQNVELNLAQGEARVFFTNASYIIQIEITDYADTHTSANANIVKTVKVTVSYKLNNNEENIELSAIVR